MPLERSQASQLSQEQTLEQMTYVLKLKTNMKKLLWRNVHPRFDEGKNSLLQGPRCYLDVYYSDSYLGSITQRTCFKAAPYAT